MIKNLLAISVSAILVNNFVLSYFLGICPFLGVSNSISSSVGMGCAVVFVMTLAGAICWMVYHLILVPLGIVFLEYIIFILVIAVLVQVVEMFMRKFSPVLYRALGIYLPLITTNCAILGCALFMVMRNYGFIEAVVFSFASGIGFAFVLIIMAGIREEMHFNDIPAVFKGASITLITAGILAMCFMGFAGMIK